MAAGRTSLVPSMQTREINRRWLETLLPGKQRRKRKDRRAQGGAGKRSKAFGWGWERKQANRGGKETDARGKDGDTCG